MGGTLYLGVLVFFHAKSGTIKNNQTAVLLYVIYNIKALKAVIRANSRNFKKGLPSVEKNGVEIFDFCLISSE